VVKRAHDESLSFQEAVEEGVFTVPGDGDLDTRAILQALADANFEGWLVVEAEQDPAKANPLEYAMKARSYLREVLGW
jgi:inosose dehydratase